MDHRFLGVLTLSALVCAGSSHAGFAQVSPPSNWGGTNGSFTYRPSANDSFGHNYFRGGKGIINVGGTPVNMPAALRMASNGGRFFAAWAFPNPALLLAMGVGSAAYMYFKDRGFDVVDGAWKTPNNVPGACYVAPCYGYQMNSGLFNSGTKSTVLQAAQAWAEGASLASSSFDWTVISCSGLQCSFQRVGSSSGTDYLGAVQVAAQPAQVTWRAVQPQEFQDAVAPYPVPDNVPIQLPVPLDWPVEIPVLNPSPATVPVPQPMRVPQGLPQPIPNTNPPQYEQPVSRITPANNPQVPWQVDITPEKVITTDPNGLTEPTPVTNTSPSGTPQESPDLCALHPDILACQKVNLGSLTPTPLPNKTVPVAITQDSGWQTGEGSCPAPRTASIMGKTLEFKFDLLCNFATAVRPIIIGFAWLSAILGFLGLSRKES